MVAAAAKPRGIQRLALGLATWAAWLFLIGLMPSTNAQGEDPVLREGLFISVRSPITSEQVNRIKSTAQRAIQRVDRPVRTLIFDFNPGRLNEGTPSFTQEYGPCADLAEYLLELPNAIRDITTVAFVHNDVSGHTVLPVLACGDIVMSADAHLGAVMRDQPGRLRKDKTEFYEEVARSRGRPNAIVLKMLDRDVEIVEGVRVGGGVCYIDGRQRQAEAKHGIIVNRPEALAGLEPGNLGFYGAEDARNRFGLCKLIKETRSDLAQEYQLSPSSLREDPLEGREPVVERMVIREPVTRALKETLERLVRQAIGNRKANVIILQLESRGGDTQVGRDIAGYLRELRDDKGDLPVMTIAYIPQKAPDAATFIALGCSDIVMGRRAEIGDFENLVLTRHAGAHDIDPDSLSPVCVSLMGLAEEQGYSPLLARGMLDPNVTIYRVQSQKGQSRWRLMTEEELQADRNGPQEWGDPKLIKPGGRKGWPFKLKAEDARQLGLAREIAESPQDLYRLYGFENVRDMSADFLFELASILRRPIVAVLLMMVGVACLFLELKMPGVGLPGVIAALCFVLYFWSQSQLAGQITMLAVLLFVLGLILIALEVFVLPGMGVTGISGIVLVVVSLALATLQKKPETTQEWLSFGQSLGTVGISLFGAICLAAAVGWYLPSIPYANRLFLTRPEEGNAADEFGLDSIDGHALDRVSLLGAYGYAETPLRPAGTARFGEEFVDVVSEGSFIPPGSRIQVIQIEGNRVVVKEEA
jgi:membrane-bound serine protease (ClpP class)